MPTSKVNHYLAQLQSPYALMAAYTAALRAHGFVTHDGESWEYAGPRPAAEAEALAKELWLNVTLAQGGR